MSELDIERSKTSRMSREKAQAESDLGCLKKYAKLIIMIINYSNFLSLSLFLSYSQVKDLEQTLSAVSAKLSQRNREYGALQIENDQNKVTTDRPLILCILMSSVSLFLTLLFVYFSSPSLSLSQATATSLEGRLKTQETQVLLTQPSPHPHPHPYPHILTLTLTLTPSHTHTPMYRCSQLRTHWPMHSQLSFNTSHS